MGCSVCLDSDASSDTQGRGVLVSQAECTHLLRLGYSAFTRQAKELGGLMSLTYSTHGR